MNNKWTTSYIYYNINICYQNDNQIKPTIINNDKHELNTNITNNNHTDDR